MATLTVKIESQLADEFLKFCENLGVTASAVISNFASKAVVNEWTLEGELFIPTERTLEALRECEDMELYPEKYPVYQSVEEMNAAFDAEQDSENDDDDESLAIWTLRLRDIIAARGARSMNSVTLKIEMESKLAQDFQKLCEDFSMSVSELVSIFAQRAVSNEWLLEGELFVPNEESMEALRECEDMKIHPEKYPVYDSFKDLVASIHDEFGDCKDEDKEYGEVQGSVECKISA